MKKLTLLLLMGGLVMWSCTKQAADDNPFFFAYDTPYQVPPFNKIKESDYLPALKKGMEEHQKEIREIAENPEAPTFENTVEALDYSGALLTRVNDVFSNMRSANTSDNLQQIAREVSPLMSRHWDDILLNEQLFQRIKAVYEAKESLNLNTEQRMLLEKTYKEFVRGGANLDDAQKEELRELNKELSLLTLTFGENVLKENNSFALVIEKKEDLAGLPENVVKAAEEAAVERGYQGKWVFTLDKPSLIPFLQYSERRDLREKLFKGYINRGDNNNEFDNKKVTSKIAALRVRKANLLGYPTYADYVLEENMAKKPQNVYDRLDQLWKPALKRAKQEAALLQKMASADDKQIKLQPWDWWYYAEKYKKAHYELDDEILRPYFKLENVQKGAFAVANKLYGITIEERTDIPKYNDDVKTFEVKEADGSHIGMLFVDYYPRASKRGGAWMSAYRKESKRDGEMVTPIITNVYNFTKPTADSPALLTFEEVTTLFHEFGHALHGLLSDCTYPRLSGTDVAQDFVELPSQIMENWASEPEVLQMYALHYKTGEPIPMELIKKIKNASLFNQGFATVEYLAASYLDMDWHTLKEAKEVDATEFENKSMAKIGIIPEIVVRYRSPYFRHVFAGGYSAGYYSYIWAEMLDADAFHAFKEKGIFDQKTARAFRENVLARGGTEDPMTLYVQFRGQEPKIEPLLERRGLN